MVEIVRPRLRFRDGRRYRPWSTAGSTVEIKSRGPIVDFDYHGRSGRGFDVDHGSIWPQLLCRPWKTARSSWSKSFGRGFDFRPWSMAGRGCDHGRNCPAVASISTMVDGSRFRPWSTARSTIEIKSRGPLNRSSDCSFDRRPNLPSKSKAAAGSTASRGFHHQPPRPSSSRLAPFDLQRLELWRLSTSRPLNSIHSRPPATLNLRHLRLSCASISRYFFSRAFAQDASA